MFVLQFIIDLLEISNNNNNNTNNNNNFIYTQKWKHKDVTEKIGLQIKTLVFELLTFESGEKNLFYDKKL